MNFKISDRETLYSLKRLDRYMESHKGFVCGGVFKNIFNKEKIRDVDVFFKSKEDFDNALEYFTKSDNHSPVYSNDNCHCFKDKQTNVDIELVKKFFDTPENIIRMFDFTIVKFAYYKEETNDGVTYKAMYLDRFFEDLQQKKLVIDADIPLPINTFERSYKYLKYGYGLCRESKIKLLESIRALQGDIDVSLSLYNGID
jgi:hypothetical protein